MYVLSLGGDLRYGFPYVAEYLGSVTLRAVECLADSWLAEWREVWLSLCGREEEAQSYCPPPYREYSVLIRSCQISHISDLLKVYQYLQA